MSLHVSKFVTRLLVMINYYFLCIFEQNGIIYNRPLGTRENHGISMHVGPTS